MQPRGLSVDLEECRVLLGRGRFVDTATRPGQDSQIGFRVANALELGDGPVAPRLQHGQQRLAGRRQRIPSDPEEAKYGRRDVLDGDRVLELTTAGTEMLRAAKGPEPQQHLVL